MQRPGEDTTQRCHSYFNLDQTPPNPRRTQAPRLMASPTSTETKSPSAAAALSMGAVIAWSVAGRPALSIDVIRDVATDAPCMPTPAGVQSTQNAVRRQGGLHAV
ncbi:hypothetical protein OF83DRAFT_1286039 [Amylostereum chailletii]|nr:hypothetical protein OF83DRAFT_1286039 [Amylostereum chailletii]